MVIMQIAFLQITFVMETQTAGIGRMSFIAMIKYKLVQTSSVISTKVIHG